ncbi:cellulase family glycosylhydrolase [Patescibacteria group bacterium]|nr:cellulase family glycosylhydrolase [Patescibacteria group bacterium]
MTQDVQKLERYFRQHRKLAYSLIILVVLMMAGTIVLSLNIQNHQAYVTTPEAHNRAANPPELNFNGNGIEGIGLNGSSLFRMYAGLGPVFSRNPSLTRQLARKSLEDAGKEGFSYMRINAGGFYGSEFQQWKSNPASWWQSFDQMVADASSYHIKLIPSIAWCLYAFPNEAGESITSFFTPGSTSNNDLKEYAKQLINRYKNNPGILFWELGNEYNLKADHANSQDTACKAGVGNGQFSSTQLGNFVTDYATYIKDLDPNHLISSGYSRPRPYAYHLWQSYLQGKKPDYQPDSFSQLTIYLRTVYPSTVNLMSVHLYPAAQNKIADWTVSDLISSADILGKKLFIGEFGDLGNNGQWKKNSSFIDNILKYVSAGKIAYSAPWTWESYKTISPAGLEDYSLIPGRQPDQKWIDKFRQINGRLKSQPAHD